MRPIPKPLLRELTIDPYYKVCARKNGNCSGRITFEHAFIYAGRQINEKWAIIPLCWWHHLGAGLDKHLNHLIALRRATEDELKKFPRRNWKDELKWLEGYEKEYAASLGRP